MRNQSARNTKCFCGSGIKYKKCCMSHTRQNFETFMAYGHENGIRLTKKAQEFFNLLQKHLENKISVEEWQKIVEKFL